MAELDDFQLEQARLAAIKGRRAKAILEDEIFQEAFEGYIAQCISRWRSTRPDDVDGRERAYRLLISAEAVKQEIVKYLNDGILAEADLGEANQAPGVIKTYIAG